MERRLVTTQRDCNALLVPTGDPVTIPSGTFVTLTQALGGSFTVVFNGNMARISGLDADAIGMPARALEFPAAEEVPALDHVWHALSTVYDPEIPVNVVDLGLIYDATLDGSAAAVTMTLTAPGCGMGPILVEEVRERILCAPGIEAVTVELVFDPPWSREMMSETAQLELGVF